MGTYEAAHSHGERRRKQRVKHEVERGRAGDAGESNNGASVQGVCQAWQALRAEANMQRSETNTKGRQNSSHADEISVGFEGSMNSVGFVCVSSNRLVSFVRSVVELGRIIPRAVNSPPTLPPPPPPSKIKRHTFLIMAECVEFPASWYTQRLSEVFSVPPRS